MTKADLLKQFREKFIDYTNVKSIEQDEDVVIAWLSEAFKEIEEEGRKKELQSLIDVFKDREPLEQYTTNVILFELKGRLSRLEDHDSEE